MLRQITRAEVVKMISTLENTRTAKFTEDDYNYVIDMGYAELATVNHVFYNEEVVSMDEYYASGELKISLEVEDDVAFVYDLYLTREDKSSDIFSHGIEKVRNTNAIYKDNRQTGMFHIDLSKVKDGKVDNAIIKYAFTPEATTEIIYIDQQTYLAMRDAFGCALYNRLNDVEREAQKRASLQRTAKAILPTYPNDYIIPEEGTDSMDEGRVSVRAMFSGLGV